MTPAEMIFAIDVLVVIVGALWFRRTRQARIRAQMVRKLYRFICDCEDTPQPIEAYMGGDRKLERAGRKLLTGWWIGD